jgi:hypothetical protein
MAKYVATILIEVEDSFEDRKPDSKMIDSYITNHIEVGEIKEKIFRKAVFMNLLKREVSVIEFE